MSNQIQNHQIILKQRPHGRAEGNTFSLVSKMLPEPKDGEMVLKTLYLSLDPYMRSRLSDAESYADPVELGEVIVGATICRVQDSKNDKFKDGDLVLAYTGWQEYAISNGKGLMKLPEDLEHPSWALGILGMPGYTGYMGLLDIGQPKEGETVVVAAATGPVGSTVGQVAKIKGARAVGIAGGPKKCKAAVEEFGFDACIDHKADDFEEQLKKACPDGIDVYYENVGGKVFEAVFKLLNNNARVPLCGVVSQYNRRDDEGPGLPNLSSDVLIRTLLTKRIRIQGFIILLNYPDQYPEFFKTMYQWVKEGKVHTLEAMIEGGLEAAPKAFVDMLEGKNFGKTVVKIADE